MTLLTSRLSDLVGGHGRLTVVSLLAGVLALQGADLATVGATGVQLQTAFGVGNTGLGLLVTVSAGIAALATLPAGILADRVDRVRLLTGAILIWSTTMLVCGASSSYLMLLVSRVALGAVVATAFPAVASLTGDLVPAVDRGRVYGFVLAGELVSGGFGFLVCGHVAELLSWRWGFWVLAPPGYLLAWAVHRWLPEPARGGASRLQPGDTEILSAARAPSSAAGRSRTSRRRRRRRSSRWWRPSWSGAGCDPGPTGC